ncbi:HD domain-containing phosphohydrolase [Halarsenatibacter silvermanii]|uniref:HDIG domain-containing protein n=1 Tax=Halarsenatibacter silvermanii TaxID=321763 RepID=A0A1G9TBN0_9FIRM|nr:HD domain-containing phosphohydrolase [Halarsenatibacter silvermanii]SDM44545.1 HDIG domain-containing protein [Halarsenatibacter silvermanii]
MNGRKFKADRISFPFHHLLFNISSISRVIKKSVANHHLQVTFACNYLAEELDWSFQRRKKTLIAAMIHDVGMFSQRKKFKLLQSEFQHTRHAEIGARLAADLPVDYEIEDIIRYHHHPWQPEDDQQEAARENIPEEAFLVHFCDRISLLIKDDQEILSQRDEILKNLEDKTPRVFKPGLVDALAELNEGFWLSLLDNEILKRNTKEILSAEDEIMDESDTLRLAKFYSGVIDFRSRFTTTHSLGVARAAEKLVYLMNFSSRIQRHMLIAGFFHDLGKLAVPPEIINKEDGLTDSEYNLMKKHVFYSYQALKTIPSLEDIAEWAGFHHETLSGTGYPFGLNGDDLSLPCKIMSVADIFVALTEDRPYRSGLEKSEVKKILKEEAQQENIEGRIVNVLLENLTEFAGLIDELQDDRDDHFENVIDSTL